MLVFQRIVASVIQPQLTILDRPEGRRYEARLGDALAGFVDYRDVGVRRILLHTEVLPAFAGRGVGTALARHVLEAARSGGSRVTLKCPYLRTFVERHPEYAAFVTHLGRGALPGSGSGRCLAGLQGRGLSGADRFEID